MWCFDIVHTHCERVTIVELTGVHHITGTIFSWGLKTYSPGKFQPCNMLLSTVFAMLEHSSPELIPLRWHLGPLDQHPSVLLSASVCPPPFGLQMWVRSRGACPPAPGPPHRATAAALPAASLRGAHGAHDPHTGTSVTEGAVLPGASCVRAPRAQAQGSTEQLLRVEAGWLPCGQCLALLPSCLPTAAALGLGRKGWPLPCQNKEPSSSRGEGQQRPSLEAFCLAVPCFSLSSCRSPQEGKEQLAGLNMCDGLFNEHLAKIWNSPSFIFCPLFFCGPLALRLCAPPYSSLQLF